MRHSRLSFLLCLLISLPLAAGAAGTARDVDMFALDTTSFRLLVEKDSYRLAWGDARIIVPWAWLVSPAESEDEAEDYVSSFHYDEQVTAFGLGDGRLGLQLSSYRIQQQGSAQAAAGRDVFLILDPGTRILQRGALDLGITKERVRSMGCFYASSHSFSVGDIDHDGLTDIGVLKEEITCTLIEKQEVEALEGPFYKQLPTRWYVLSGNRWRHESAYDGRLARRYRELPLIGLIKSPVEFVMGLYRLD